MKPLISIVVPVYGVENYLTDCIDSIISQSYKNIEIILVDDGSKDSCPKICDEYAKKDKRIKVIHKKNGGLSDARNAGIEAATGKLITFIDSDDNVDADYIKQLYETMREYGADISVCGRTAFYGDKQVSYSSDKKMNLNQKEALTKILYHEDIDSTSWAKLYKKELFDNIKFPKGENYEDTSTTYKLFLQSKNIACNLKSQYNYMIRSNSIMTHSFSEKDMLLLTSWDNMASTILEYYPDLSAAAIRGRTYARLCALRRVVNLEKRNKKLEKEFKKFILNNRHTMLKDKRCPKRDKIAILTLLFGVFIFKSSWAFYCKLTGRKS